MSIIKSKFADGSNAKIRLVIFDWDGTLMDSGAKIIRCFQSTASDFDLRLPEAEQIRQYIGLSLVESWSKLYPVLTFGEVNELVARYREYWIHLDTTPMPLFEGVEKGLRQLNEAGFWLAVATGKSRAGLDRAMTSCGLGDQFVYTRCADESRSKPHPQMLLDVLGYTGLEAEEAVMVGDTTFDLQMAHSVGMRAIAVNYGYHEEAQLLQQMNRDVDHMVHCFREISSVLA